MPKKKPTWGCTPAVIKALDYIGSHRKSRVIPGKKGCPVSKRTANRLVTILWAMWLSNGKEIILTLEGERRWSARHPHSKYRIS